VLPEPPWEQAVIMSAAVNAARTSLVFIERYPKEEATVSETQNQTNGLAAISDRAAGFYRLIAAFETLMKQL